MYPYFRQRYYHPKNIELVLNPSEFLAKHQLYMWLLRDRVILFSPEVSFRKSILTEDSTIFDTAEYYLTLNTKEYAYNTSTKNLSRI